MKSQFEPEELVFGRERTILEEIQNNPNLHHNALLKLIVPKYMAKTTFERTKNRLIEKNVLTVSQIGNKKFYIFSKNYQKNSLQLMERVSHEKYQSLQREIKRINEDYSYKDVDEKITTCVQLLRELLKIDNEFTVLDSIKNPKKTLYKDEHLSIQEMISKVFELVKKDKENKLIFPAIMSYRELDTSNSLK